MGSYHNVRLPDTIERGATGGGNFKTTIIDLGNGLEKRNISWSQFKPRYDISYGILEAEDFYDVRDFFYARQGSAYSFAFKDFSDYQIPDDLLTIEPIGVGDTTKKIFQITKSYTSGPATYYRIIEKPVTGTVSVYLGATLQASGYTIDYDSGLVTFGTAPGSSVVVGVKGEFDTPVRFSTDKFDITLEQIRAGTIPNLQIVGVIGERV
jgi:uncharacterized protein (TIGR02217 family)